MNNVKSERAVERKKQREKIVILQGNLQREVNLVRKLKTRLKRTFRAFIEAFERCERLNKMTTELIAEYGTKDAFTPTDQKKGAKT